jgi:hypothetical protein
MFNPNAYITRISSQRGIGEHILENTGGRYDPGVDHGVSTSITNAPHYRYAHTGVWTGEEMIVWGGTIPPDVTT